MITDLDPPPGWPVPALPCLDTSIAVLRADQGGSVRWVPAVVWSITGGDAPFDPATSAPPSESRRQLGAFLRMGLETVRDGTPLAPTPPAVATPGWRLEVDGDHERYTVVCPDGRIGVDGSCDAADTEERAVRDSWLAGLLRWRHVVLLTGPRLSTGDHVDLGAASRSGRLLRGIATYRPPPAGFLPIPSRTIGGTCFLTRRHVL